MPYGSRVRAVSRRTVFGAVAFGRTCRFTAYLLGNVVWRRRLVSMRTNQDHRALTLAPAAGRSCGVHGQLQLVHFATGGDQACVRRAPGGRPRERHLQPAAPRQDNNGPQPSTRFCRRGQARDQEEEAQQEEGCQTVMRPDLVRLPARSRNSAASRPGTKGHQSGPFAEQPRPSVSSARSGSPIYEICMHAQIRVICTPMS